jgi:hypothetical protein
VRPSDLIEGDLERLLFDAKVAELLAREDVKALQKMRESARAHRRMKRHGG